MSSPTIQNLNKSNNTSRKSSSPMDTASNSLTKPEDNGILNNNQPAEKEPEPVRRINLSTLSQHNIKSTFYTTTTLRKILPSPKDPIPTENKQNIIYKLGCKDFDAVYIGESKRAYQTRIGEHISAVRKANTKRYETADHCWKFNHDFNWTENKILGHELNTTTRKIKETIHSIKRESCINGISYNLPDFWLPAIKVKRDRNTQTENNRQNSPNRVH